MCLVRRYVVEQELAMYSSSADEKREVVLIEMHVNKTKLEETTLMQFLSNRFRIIGEICMDGPSICFASKERHWADWMITIAQTFAEVSECLHGGLFPILVGQAPLSMFMQLGMTIGRPIPMVNANQGVWSLFENLPGDNECSGNKLLSLQSQKLSGGDKSRTFALVFVTTNGRYSISDANLAQIQNALPGGISIGHSFRISPVPRDDGDAIEVNGDPLSPGYNYNAISDEIEQKFFEVHQQSKDTCSGMIIACEAPAPIALQVGAMYKHNVYGPYFMVDLVQGEYVLSYTNSEFRSLE